MVPPDSDLSSERREDSVSSALLQLRVVSDASGEVGDLVGRRQFPGGRTARGTILARRLKVGAVTSPAITAVPVLCFLSFPIGPFLLLLILAAGLRC